MQAFKLNGYRFDDRELKCNKRKADNVFSAGEDSYMGIISCWVWGKTINSISTMEWLVAVSYAT